MTDQQQETQQQEQQWQQSPPQQQQYSGPDRRSQRDFDFLFSQMQSQSSASDQTREWVTAYLTKLRQDVSTLETLTSQHLLALSRQEIIREVTSAVVPIIASQVRQDVMEELQNKR